MTSRFTGPACRARLSFLCVALLLCGLLTQPAPSARSASLDTIADYVLGQPDFTSNTPSSGASGLDHPWAAAVDQSIGRLYVADIYNSRVLSWPSAATRTNGNPADIVIGQPDFASNQPNQSPMSVQPRADTLYWPVSVAVDGDGNVYVADSGNGRVLVYTAPITTSMSASRVFGQPNLTTRLPPAAAADRFTLPSAIALDTGGNLYVADYNSHRILEFDAALTGDTIADRVFGQPDFTSSNMADRVPTSNTLSKPSGLAVDAAGNLYASDEGDNRVLEYDAPLLNDTNADRVFGQLDFVTSPPNIGGISAASLKQPQGITLDAAGRLYVADAGNRRVLVYDMPLLSDARADYVFGWSDFANTMPTAGGIGLAWTMGVALDSLGTLYIADSANRVLVYDQPLPEPGLMIGGLSPIEVAAGGSAFTLTVQGRFESGAAVRWNGADRPTSAIAPGRLAVHISAADIASVGMASIAVANPGAGGVSATRTLTIYDPLPLDTVADGVLGQAGFQSILASYDGTQSSSLQPGVGIAVQPGGERLFVSDFLNSRVLSWPDAATFTNGQAPDLVLGQPDFIARGACPVVVSASTLCRLVDVAADGAGNVYVADTYNSRVLAYDAPLSNGMAATHVFGQPNFTSSAANNGGVSASSLNFPHGVVVDAAGDLYIADGNNRVLTYADPLSSDMIADQVFGQPDFGSSAPNNGGISASTLNLPWGVALDRASNLYITDTGNNRVLRYHAPSGDTIADQVFGQPDFASNTPNNGGVGASTLNYPYHVAVDRFDNLYISDSANNRVLEYNAPLLGDSAADRVFGQNSMTGNAANSGGRGRSSLYSPNGVATDASSNVYVSDVSNYRVLRYNTPVVGVLPAISAMAPLSAIAGGTAFTLTVTGTGFMHGMAVSWSGADQPTTVISETLLTAQIGADDIATAGAVSVTIALPDGSGSNANSFIIDNPLPMIDSLSRTRAVVGEAGFTLAITGTNFVSTSIVRWNGADRPTTFVSSTQLTAQISAGNIAIAGQAMVTVRNAPPGGGLSNAAAFTIRSSYRTYLPLVAR